MYFKPGLGKDVLKYYNALRKAQISGYLTRVARYESLERICRQRAKSAKFLISASMLNQITFFILVAFLGFVVGRIGHILGGHKKSPHHWIYGYVLIIIGVLFGEGVLWSCLFLFGVGLFKSDLIDFLKMRFYGVDDVKVKKFWGID